ncbi:DUF4347 domain-containing protein [Roseomonas fluvialis]|uniref:DUF4347 domain-containing protein n=1 Tax=Roseomonas fluvialis TaxID=1750527 RepID=A0ABM7Y3D7_9PROT|nr:DUF4347 domain-containing protein [Roseomonas fluvialis]BDG72654.1 hypothetical protein Rmf_25830 [Roseomonas fluvialis]
MRTAIDTLYLYDPQFAANAQAFKDETGGTCAMHPVSCLDTLKAALDGYVQVGFIIFDTHGSPGALSLADGGTVDGMDFGMLGLIPPTLLRRQARVLFYGCNLGEGAEGDTFLDEFGHAAFRGKGGTAGASTVTNLSWSIGSIGSAGVWMNPFSLFGARLKVVRFNEAGERATSASVDRWGHRD